MQTYCNTAIVFCNVGNSTVCSFLIQHAFGILKYRICRYVERSSIGTSINGKFGDGLLWRCGDERVWRLTPPSFPRLLYVIYEASRAWVSWILLLVSPAILIAWLFTCTVCTARLHARINLHGELPWRLFNAIFNVNRLPYRRANVYLHRYVPFRLLRITANAKQTRNRLERISTRSAYMKHRSSIQWIMQCCCSYVYFNLLYNRSGCRIVRIFERTMRREKNHYPSFSREKFIREE